MTSPNINVFILLGTVLGYASVILLGLDVTIVDDVDFNTIVQVRSDRLLPLASTAPCRCYSSSFLNIVSSS